VLVGASVGADAGACCTEFCPVMTGMAEAEAKAGGRRNAERVVCCLCCCSSLAWVPLSLPPPPASSPSVVLLPLAPALAPPSPLAAGARCWSAATPTTLEIECVLRCSRSHIMSSLPPLHRM